MTAPTSGSVTAGVAASPHPERLTALLNIIEFVLSYGESDGESPAEADTLAFDASRLLIETSSSMMAQAGPVPVKGALSLEAAFLSTFAVMLVAATSPSALRIALAHTATCLDEAYASRTPIDLNTIGAS